MLKLSNIFFVLACMIFFSLDSAWSVQVGGASDTSEANESAPGSDHYRQFADVFERDTLTGDWGGLRTRLKEYGVTISPRLTQFYQGLTAGKGNKQFEYGSKADVLVNVELEKLGLWKGLSVTTHIEYNFGQSVNGRGGTMVPVNTALQFPGMVDEEAFDVSSVYVRQTIGDSFSIIAGKINIVDLAATKPFMGGAGINSFWNSSFAAPPSGTVPPYLFGAMFSVRTDPAVFGLWIYDPNSVVNQTGFERPFRDGVTFRGTVDFPVSIAGLSGHQGVVALYSTKDGRDISSMDQTLILPRLRRDTVGMKDSRYYFAYTFDQFLYQSPTNSEEGVGIFGQFGISDGNPNRLYWSALTGLGGTGLIPSRSRDTWGVGFYYDVLSPFLQDAIDTSTPGFEPKLVIRDEYGGEVFYNFSVTRWLDIGADLQVARPFQEKTPAVYFGMRTVIRF